MAYAVPFQSQGVETPRAWRIGLAWLGESAVLVGAMLLAAQIRVQLPIGAALGAGYDPLPIGIFPFLALITAIVLAVGQRPTLIALLGDAHPYRRFLLALIASALLALIVFPEISQLQVGYFVGFGAAVGFVAIAWTARLYLAQPGSDLVRDLARLWRNRFLAGLWLRNNIEARYSQQVLGILWIVLLPISTSVVLSIAFSQFMRVELDVPFVAFYLAAMIHYNIFSNSVQGSAVAITSRMGLITQVYFPREIIILVQLGETLVDYGFAFLAMLVINALTGILPNSYFIWLPLLLLITFVMTLGVMLIIGTLNVLIRDIPQLVGVALQLLFFMTPIIYPLESLPVQYRFLFVINPIAAVVQGFRDVIVYGRAPDVTTLYYPIVFAGVVLIFGYTLFKSIEDKMADML